MTSQPLATMKRCKLGARNSLLPNSTRWVAMRMILLSRQETQNILHSSLGGPAQLAGWRRGRHLNERVVWFNEAAGFIKKGTVGRSMLLRPRTIDQKECS